MSRSFRDQFHRITKRLNREVLNRWNNGGHDTDEKDKELKRLNRKSGGHKKKWYQRKWKQAEIDKKNEYIDDE